MAVPISRYTFFLKKVFSRVPKTALLSLVFLFILLGSTTQTFAVYDNFTSLFNGGPIAPKLDVLSTTKPISSTEVKQDFVFNFQASFNTQVGGDNPLDWHWWRIARLDDPHTFILRICPTSSSGTIDATKCVFSDVPTAYYVDEDDIKPNGQAICSGNPQVCTLPTSAANDGWPKVYGRVVTVKYSGSNQVLDNNVNSNWFTNNGDRRSQFNVTFSANDLSSLTASGGYSPVNESELFKLGDPTKYNADIWYCGDTELAYNPSENFPSGIVPDPSTGISQFNNLCGDYRFYFKIASTTFKLPASAAEAIATSPSESSATADTNQSTQSGLPSCGALGVGGTVTGCVARIVYYLIYWPISWFAGLMGTIFDFLLGYSLSDSSYRMAFAVNGWKLMRDISNIFFIIILVWTGLSAVFNTEKANMKRVVTQLIFNALLINFSLFGTRVVIDLSNIVARVFYNSVHVCQGECKDNDNDGKFDNFLTGPGGYKSLSSKIVSSFNPQKIFAAKTLASNEQVGGAQNTKTFDVDDDAGYFIIVSLGAAVIMFGVAMMFWKVAFMFLGRVIGLYMAMIFAPFAVLTRGGMPLVGGMKGLSWEEWTKDLTNYALLAPIFVFFLYIIYSFLDTGFLKIIQPESGFFGTLISIAIPMLIIYFMIAEGVNIAKRFAGKIGLAVQNLAQQGVGFAVGAAAGIGGLAASGLIGGAASAANKTKFGEWLRDKGQSTGMGGWLARKGISTLNATEKSTFDVRNSGLGKNLFKQMGMSTTDAKAVSVLGLGTKATADGFQGRVERDQKKKEATAKLLESKQDQADIDAYNEKARKQYQEKIEKIIQDKLYATHGKTSIDDWKENDKAKYEKARQQVLKEAPTQKAIETVEKPKEKKSVQEMNIARKEKYVENLKKGGVVNNFLGSDSPIGMMLGANISASGNKKAAKKISEGLKIEKDLSEINNTLKKGFREIIALEKVKNGPIWKNDLSASQRLDLMQGKDIEYTDKKGNKVRGGLYDVVKDKDPDLAKALDVEVLAAENDKDKNKAILEEIKARQQFKFDFKAMNKKIQEAEDFYAKNPTATNLNKVEELRAERVKLKNDQKKWQDLDKYISEQKKKLEGKE